jgi:hypothetical protein
VKEAPPVAGLFPFWAECGLLRRTIERQLSRKPTFLPGAASGAVGHDLSFTKHPAIGSYMRIADLKQFLIEVGEISCAPARLNDGNRHLAAVGNVTEDDRSSAGADLNECSDNI